MPNYDDMTIEELEQLNNELGNQRLEIKEKQREIVAVMDRKRAAMRAQAQIAVMSEPDKAAMAQILKAEGIETAEAIGNPGTKEAGD